MVKRSRRTRDQERIQRRLSILPSLFTVGNIFCGYYSIISTLHSNWDRAAILIGIGYILDGLDGRIARLTKSASEFGVQLDSIADVVTFGAAPAILAFSWGFGPIEGLANPANHIVQFGFLATFLFIMCGALRLARFNVQTKDGGSKRYFVGLPIPMGAGLLASIVHYFKTPTLMVGSAYLWGWLVVIVAMLMISTVRYFSFKEFDIKKARPSLALAAAALLIGLIIFYSEVMLLALSTIYVSSGLITELVRVVQRFLPSGSQKPSESPRGNIKN